MRDKLKKTIKKYSLLKKGDRVVIGVSGGPDSVALLYLLRSISKEYNLSLHIAHLDHMLRPGSEKDRKFVEKLADKLSIPITCAVVNVRELSKFGSLEELARNARLGFFFKVAKKIRASKIALGHNLDDQAETVLMRIIRGAGLYGLSAILPIRRIYGYEVIRPLIEIERKQINSYLKRIKLKPRIDLSNKKDVFLRNRLRNRLITQLEREYNKNIKKVLSNIAASAALDYDYLSKVAIKALGKLGKKINLEKFLRLHPAIRRLVLRESIRQLKGDTRQISFQHIEEIEDLIVHRPSKSIVDLPKGISVVKKENYLSFYRK